MKIIFLTFIFLLSSNIHAEWGLVGGMGKEGLTLKDVSGNETTGTTEIWSPLAGVSRRSKLNSTWMLEVDLLAARRGQHILAIERQWWDILVPIQAKYMLSGNHVGFGIGGFASYAVTGVSQTDPSGTSSFDFGDFGYDKLDWGALASASVEVPLGKYQFKIEARYLYGLRNRLVIYIDPASAKTSSIDVLGVLYF